VQNGTKALSSEQALSADQADRVAASDVAAVVEMTNTFSFSPETIRIPVGGTVEWRNTSITTHTGRWKS
jgi:plastocyanin